MCTNRNRGKDINSAKESNNMINDKTPKIFISYSWSSDDFVLQLAERLMSHGIDVILDKWDLSEGQDKYAFMEQCVNNPDVDKVLIICDRIYAEKANNRKGGAGEETVIISNEIYNDVTQEKFIPIVAECDEFGKPFILTYIKSRIYIDLSDNEKYESEYEKLLRNIYEQPMYKKPKLGLKPEWLTTDKVNLFPLQDLIRQLKGAVNPNKQISLINRFETQHIEILKSYYSSDISNEKKLCELWAELKIVRNYFLDWLETLLEISYDIREILCDYFEKMNNTLICIKTFKENANSCTEDELEIYKIYIWELFICTVTCLRHYERYDILNGMLSNTYFLNESVFGGRVKPFNYAKFYHYSHILENYKLKTEKKQLFTLVGNVLCTERERKPIYTKESISQADIFLCQMFSSLAYVDDKTDYTCRYWFPICYVYAQKDFNEWEKMKSKRYCKKMFILFGVSNIEELKQKLTSCHYSNDMRYPGSWYSVPAILDSITLNEIGTLN